jgi:hypothetical protein
MQENDRFDLMILLLAELIEIVITESGNQQGNQYANSPGVTGIDPTLIIFPITPAFCAARRCSGS